MSIDESLTGVTDSLDNDNNLKMMMLLTMNSYLIPNTTLSVRF